MKTIFIEMERLRNIHKGCLQDCANQELVTSYRRFIYHTLAVAGKENDDS